MHTQSTERAHTHKRETLIHAGERRAYTHKSDVHTHKRATYNTQESNTYTYESDTQIHVRATHILAGKRRAYTQESDTHTCKRTICKRATRMDFSKRRTNTLKSKARMGWLRLVGSLELHVSFAKEPYKRDCTLQKRRIISRSLLIITTPYTKEKDAHLHKRATHIHTRERRTHTRDSDAHTHKRAMHVHAGERRTYTQESNANLLELHICIGTCIRTE